MIEDVLPSSGSGSALPTPVLLLAGVSTVIATLVSGMSIYLHLKNYRKPILQRMVVRIMVMVPLYAISSFISLFSLEAAFFIDVVRDIYEAFVIYCFFDLLIDYLGGERSLIILLHGRPPKYPVFPGNLFWREVDVSDPHTFLFLKRGVIQYVQVKPILALVTVILKAAGKYHEGDLRANSGYLYVSIVYNISICLSLYCLAIFWMCVNDDLRPFRPMPKFLCVKGILFFSFWQSIFVSILVAAGAIKKLGPYTDNEHISLGLTDTLICLEMPLFAIAHLYAFATRDFIDPHVQYVARMPVFYAFRDAFGLKDVVEDCKATLRGEGMDYREFEPSEGYMHQGAGRDRRIRAGLRYSQGGKRKYWLPRQQSKGGRMDRVIERVAGTVQDEGVYAPLLAGQAENVVHTAADLRSPAEEDTLFDSTGADEGFDLPFGDLDRMDEELFEHGKMYVFGDYNYPCVDISSETARNMMWVEEERILRDERGAYFSPIGGPHRGVTGYGAVGSSHDNMRQWQADITDRIRVKGKTRAGGHEVVIDKEHDRVPDMSEGEVRLNWTKAKKSTPIQSSRIRKISKTESFANSPASSSSALSTPRVSSLPTQKEPVQPVLPPDAVDLVVEDRHAAEVELSRERRKGEPAMRGGAGVHKVYRRGYAADGDEHREEDKVKIERGADEEQFRNTFDIGDDVDSIADAEELVADELIVARAMTPPAHARLIVTPPELDDNPWA